MVTAGLDMHFVFAMQRPRPVAERRLSVAVAVFGLLATTCDGGPQVIRGEGVLRIDRTSIDFGQVYIGLGPLETVTVRNGGLAPIRIDTRIVGQTDGYVFGPATAELGPGGTVDLQVFFRPRQPGARTAELLLTSNAAGTANAAIQLSAVAIDTPDCEDGNGCTVDTFDFETERCVRRAEPLPCNDFNLCTGQDTCVDGICLGAAVDCDDGDDCTDDACDPSVGCVNVPTGRCDDGNPCTLDRCLADGGCQHENLSDGTPCNDNEQCTADDVCFRGRCRGIDIDLEGEPCDDGDPCSLGEQCTSGECIDPNYDYPSIGDVTFTATIGVPAPRTAENLIVDRNNRAYVGIEGGLAAIDECGFFEWVNDTIGTPNFAAAVSLPGIVTVPVGSTLFDIDTALGSPIRSLDLVPALRVGTASTATVTGQVLDIAVRNSGALVVSVTRTVTTTAAVTTAGFLLEVNAAHTIAMRMQALGDSRATRVALDADESVVAILRRGADQPDPGEERVARLGIDGVPNGTWATSEVLAARTDLALGLDGEVLWAGFTSIDRRGNVSPLTALPPDPTRLRTGAPVTFGDVVYAIVERPQDGGRQHLVALTSTGGPARFELELPGPTIQHSPTVDAQGRVYLVTAQGDLLIVSSAGRTLLQTPLPMASTPVEGVALTLTARGILLVIAGDTLMGVRGVAGLANSSWPRSRRDNLSTSHR